MVEPL